MTISGSAWPIKPRRNNVPSLTLFPDARDGAVGQHPERMERFCDVAAQAQNRDPKSSTYGNLKGTWRDAGVTDQNTVEFCMQDAALLWMNHRDWIPKPARQKLGRNIITLSIEGCLRQRVTFSYTNIAILNAANLIVLGEMLIGPMSSTKGCGGSTAFALWTWAYGTEYDSPTYYKRRSQRAAIHSSPRQSERARRTAIGLLELLWNDLALNWYPGRKSLAGPTAAVRLSARPGRARSQPGRAGLAAQGRFGRNPDRLEGRRWVPPEKLQNLPHATSPRGAAGMGHAPGRVADTR